MEIFYFTGAGNFYSVANELSKHIKGSRLISTVKRSKMRENKNEKIYDT